MKPSPKVLREKLAATFRKSAETLRRQVEEKRNPAIAQQNITARRARITASISADADYLEQIGQVMENMAADLEKNQLPKILRGVTTRGMVEALLSQRRSKPGLHKSHVRDLLRSCKFSRGPGVCSARKAFKRLMFIDGHECFLELASLKQIDTMLVLCRNANGDVYLGSAIPDLNTDRRFLLAGIKADEHWKIAHEIVMLYVKGPSPEQERAKKLKAMETDLIGVRIPGFFPTPMAIAIEMVRMADIRAGMTVLEPSAGKGDIAEAIAGQHPDAELTVVEVSHTLAKILEAKGFNTRSEDFLAQTGFYDRIIMNPPFEKGQDIDHVRWAYNRLKPKGMLVSIMGEGPFFRSDKKSVSFREWFDSKNGTYEPLGHGSFQGAESFNQTGVNSRIVILAK
ncbi:hypothetical protein ES703_97078 [subsurface metagenome]